MSQGQYSYRLRLEDGQSVLVADLATANRVYPGADFEAAFEQMPGGAVVGTNLTDALKADRAAIRAAAKDAKPDPEPAETAVKADTKADDKSDADKSEKK